MELDDLELEMLKELVPYKTLAPSPLEIICYIKDLNRENELLNNIINKAIEYINEYKDGKPTIINGYEEIEYIESDIILNILRGEDNEEHIEYEISQLKGTLEQLDKLSIRGENNE